MCGDDKCEGENCENCEEDCGPCPSCPHSVCDTGVALTTTVCRDACVDEVCAQDPSCCDMGYWSVDCLKQATELCSSDPCVKAVCLADEDCCAEDWTSDCVEAAKTECSTSCNCAHDPCEVGAALDPNCSPCVEQICLADNYCCTDDWDGICRDEVGSVCGIVCP